MTSSEEQFEAFLNSDTVSDDFFIEIVENKLNIKRETFKLRLVLFSPATGKNDHFASIVYRAKIKIEILESKSRQSVDVIIKVSLVSSKGLKEFSVAPRERFVYEDVLSSYEKIWLERAGEKITFAPKSIKFESDPYDIIVLDDLKPNDYKMLDRKVGLNVSQAKILLEKLAKFHAASAVRYQKDGVIQTYFDRKASMPPLTEDSPFSEGFRRMYQTFSESIKNYGDCDEAHDKVSRWDFRKILTLWVDMGGPMRCGFQVMNHGDLWLNNMLFKSDEDGNPIDVSMIDFQGPFWWTPSIDLLYFLISSVADEYKITHFDGFVEFYHEQLTVALKKLKYDQQIPTLVELQEDMLDKGGFASTCLMFILFVVKNDSAEELDMKAVIRDPEILKSLYNGASYRKSVTLWLQFFNKRGFLDAFIKKEE